MKRRAQSKRKHNRQAILIILALTGLAWAGLFARYGGGFRDVFELKGPDAKKTASGVFIEEMPEWRKKIWDATWRTALPKIKSTFQVVQAEGTWPKIIQATIDPPDVHVGDIQKLSIILEDPEPIISVIARIETDHGIKELPLSLVSQSADAEILAPRYALNRKNELVSFEKAEPRFKTAYAAGELQKLKYEGEWTVADTHDALYHTTFVAKDAKGRENSITLAWSDACLIPYAGAWNITSYGACSLFGVDGVEQGSATIQTYTLTLNAGATFAYNSGHGITMTSGAIAIANTAQIKQTNIWARDLDSDTWLSPDTWLAQDAQPAGYDRRGSKSQYDCDDSRGEVYPDSPNSGPESTDFNCDSLISDVTGSGCYVQFAGCFGGVWNSGSAPGCGVSAGWTGCDWLWNGSNFFCDYPIVGGGSATQYCM